MALSEYEEMVVAELEAQFTGERRPGLNWRRLMAPSACLLAGAVLLVAAHHGALLIRLSDLLGFSTGAITMTLGLAGYFALLGCAFLLGHAVHGMRPSPARQTGTDRLVSPAGRR
ncbi:MAG: hypothetical protein ACRD0C_15300 [Acidimicrobiia bacterium]